MDLIKTKSDEILENVQGLDMLGKDYKGSTKIPLEETRKLNEAFALTADLATIAGKIEKCIQDDDEGISPISELYEKQISGVNYICRWVKWEDNKLNNRQQIDKSKRKKKNCFRR